MVRSEQILLQEIEQLRKKLAQVIDSKGYNDTKTIQLSQSLDQSLNDYHHLKYIKQHRERKKVNSN